MEKSLLVFVFPESCSEASDQHIQRTNISHHCRYVQVSTSNYTLPRGRVRLEEGRINIRRPVVLIVTAVLIIILAFALWEFAIRDFINSDGETEYRIEFWYGNDSMGKVSMTEIKTLPTTSYVDIYSQGEGVVTDEGPLVKDVILLIVNQSLLTNTTNVILTSDLKGDERTITWGEIANESNSYILDFTKRGTTKFTSPETQKKDRVRDVTDIRIGA